MTDQENNNSISGNPFAALFSSLADAKQFAAGQKQQLRQLAGQGRAGPRGEGPGESSAAAEVGERAAGCSLVPCVPAKAFPGCEC